MENTEKVIKMKNVLIYAGLLLAYGYAYHKGFRNGAEFSKAVMDAVAKKEGV